MSYRIKSARLLGGCRDGDVMAVPSAVVEDEATLDRFEVENTASEPELCFCVFVPLPFDQPRSKYVLRYTYEFQGSWYDMNTPYMECTKTERVLRSDPTGEPA